MPLSAASRRADCTSTRSMIGAGAVSTMWMRMRLSSCKSSEESAIDRVGLPIVSTPISSMGPPPARSADRVPPVSGTGWVTNVSPESCVNVGLVSQVCGIARFVRLR
jgi:hypothetical protein